jgi:hypothetical protein
MFCWFYYSGASSYWPTTYFICFVLYEEFVDDKRVIRIRKSLFHYQDFYQTWLYIWVTRMSYKKQEPLTLREHLSSPPFFGGFRVTHVFNVCVVLLCVFTFWVPCCDVPYDFRMNAMFGSSLSPVLGSSLIYVICGW